MQKVLLVQIARRTPKQKTEIFLCSCIAIFRSDLSFFTWFPPQRCCTWHALYSFMQSSSIVVVGTPGEGAARLEQCGRLEVIDEPEVEAGLLMLLWVG